MLAAGRHVLSAYGDIVDKATDGALLIDCSTVAVHSARRARAIACQPQAGHRRICFQRP